MCTTCLQQVVGVYLAMLLPGKVSLMIDSVLIVSHYCVFWLRILHIAVRVKR